MRGPEIGPRVLFSINWYNSSMSFSRVGVFYNELKTHVAPLAQEAVSFLRARGVHTVLLTALDPLPEVDVLLSMGGDGTMLRCARACAPKRVPVLGINCGTLGFLAAAEKEEMTLALQTLLDGQCTLHTRLMLRAVVRQNGTEQTFAALNDCVLHASNMRAFFIDAAFNTTPMPSYFGDGVIVSTPTGSTAYSLAAGGPIIAPQVNAWVVTPVCPHSLNERPIVLPAEGTLQLKPSFKNAEDSAIVSFDGQIHTPVGPGAEILISRAPEAAQLFTLPQRNFFTMLHKKLNWGEQAC